MILADAACSSRSTARPPITYGMNSPCLAMWCWKAMGAGRCWRATRWGTAECSPNPAAACPATICRMGRAARAPSPTPPGQSPIPPATPPLARPTAKAAQPPIPTYTPASSMMPAPASTTCGRATTTPAWAASSAATRPRCCTATRLSSTAMPTPQTTR